MKCPDWKLNWMSGANWKKCAYILLLHKWRSNCHWSNIDVILITAGSFLLHDIRKFSYWKWSDIFVNIHFFWINENEVILANFDKTFFLSSWTTLGFSMIFANNRTGRDVSFTFHEANGRRCFCFLFHYAHVRILYVVWYNFFVGSSKRSCCFILSRSFEYINSTWKCYNKKSTRKMSHIF